MYTNLVLAEIGEDKQMNTDSKGYQSNIASHQSLSLPKPPSRLVILTQSILRRKSCPRERGSCKKTLLKADAATSFILAA